LRRQAPPRHEGSFPNDGYGFSGVCMRPAMPAGSRSLDDGTKRVQGGRRERWIIGLGVLCIALGLFGRIVDAYADCTSCHAGIESIADGPMGERIRRLGRRHGDTAGCVVCHGGNPRASDRMAAHQGAPAALTDAGGPAGFYTNPGANAVAERTCGQCHERYAERWRKSVMSTDAEKIERNLCAPAWQKRMLRGAAFRLFGRFAIEDDDGPEPIAGTPAYRTRMKSVVVGLRERFPERLHAIPTIVPRQDRDTVAAPCQDCHGQQGRTDRGTGCSACHIPYRRGETYQGTDPTIPKALPDRLLVHRIQGTENTTVSLPARPDRAWSGIPLETCFGCHFDPRNLGVSELGAVHAHYGDTRRPSSGGLLCQDCHTSIEMHGDGNLAATSTAQREVACEDCHGTTDRFPWELPLGSQDPEVGDAQEGSARGLAAEPTGTTGKLDQPTDGYLLTSRGNPFGNVVKSRERIVLRSASGLVYEVPLLKQRAQQGAWRSELGRQVKTVGNGHAAMACTDCHADWAPPCYGCHVDSTATEDANSQVDDRESLREAASRLAPRR
jgi:hypothetical protein